MVLVSHSECKVEYTHCVNLKTELIKLMDRSLPKQTKLDNDVP